MFLKKIFTFVLSLIVISESAFVDTLIKCSKDDGKCQIKLMQKIIKDIAELGVPELDIPPIDPVHLKNLTVSILDVLDLTFDGIVKGVKNCDFNKFTPNVDDGIATLDITCDLVIKGKYKVISSGPVLKSLLGGESFHGDGDGKVKIERMNFKLIMPFEVKKKGDDFFLIGKRNKLTYTFDILGSIKFQANKLYLGETESSASIVKLMNENWRIIAQSFAKNIIDIAIDFVFNFTNKFFTSVPTKYYFIEDLSPYVKNE